jgi:hypothetical protein
LGSILVIRFHLTNGNELAGFFRNATFLHTKWA